jgi:HNH endonuclease/AP2 domain
MNPTRLREVLDYDPETGIFTWKVRVSTNVPVGTVAGSLDGGSYLNIHLDGRAYLAHRLAWLYVHGEWPVSQVDHINRIKTDNRFTNLRLATASQNAQNQRRDQRQGTSRLLGVSWNSTAGRWASRITVQGRVKFLGSFDTEEDAHAAYLAAKAIMHPYAVAGGD